MKKTTVSELMPMYIEERRKEYEAGKKPQLRLVRSRQEKTIKEGTFKEMKRIGFRDIVGEWGDLGPSEITPKKFKDFCDKSTHDMANARKVLNGFQAWCADKEYTDRHHKYKIPKYIRRIRHVLSTDEIRKLMAEAVKDDINYMFVTLGLPHGLRPHERTQLLKTDFDFKSKCINIRWETVKTKKGRMVPINDHCIEKYQDIFAKTTSPYVFEHAHDEFRHKVRGWYQYRWRKLLRCAGLFDRKTGKLYDITPHDLRATAEKFAALDPMVTPIMRKLVFGADPKLQDDVYITSAERHELSRTTNAATSESIGVNGINQIISGAA